MMKFTGAIGTLLAGIIAVPTVALGEHDADAAVASLEGALRKTVETLELLAGIRDTAVSGDPITTAVATSVTEEPIEGQRERDEKLQLLRTQVSLLQQELDIVEARILDPSSSDANDAGPKLVPAAPRTNPSDGLTQGLDPAVLDAMRGLKRPTVVQVVEEPVEPAVEHEGYSADTLLQAQACYRANQYSRGLALLDGDESPAALYWSARCLERLQRLDEASALYERVAGLDDGGSYTARAKTSLEFVKWKADFVDKLPTRKEESPR
jgi:hypothetical protein